MLFFFFLFLPSFAFFFFFPKQKLNVFDNNLCIQCIKSKIGLIIFTSLKSREGKTSRLRKVSHHGERESWVDVS